MTLIQDTEALAEKFGLDTDQVTRQGLYFRLDLLDEECGETSDAFDDSNAEEFVDGLIDVVVVALTTLQLAGVDVQRAWDEVFLANMSKEVGSKPGRVSPSGFDLIKPEGWIAPDHSQNLGVLRDVL